jgi:predicted AAA+ superfamily ATPase
MIHRLLHDLISLRLRQFPAVAIVGPRQAGKTTLAKLFSAGYYDLEQEGDRVKLDLRWNEIVENDELVVLDEAQSWPEIFTRLRGAIDARRGLKGRFLLLGSVSPTLMKHVADSLAGRLAIVDLSPLTAAELPVSHGDALWEHGGFPDGGALLSDMGSYPVWQESYLRQMVHQDLPMWGLPSKPQQTERLLRLIAAMHGKQLNASQLGKSLGVSYHTVQSHIDFLEGAFLIRKLTPYFANNFPKRLTKSPKLYWRDSGLLHCLLGLASTKELREKPWAGESWEGWVIEQILAVRRAKGESIREHYFRTNDGLECDLLLETDAGIEIIEIKLSSSPPKQAFTKLAKIAALVNASRQVVISRIPDTEVVDSGDRWSTNIHSYLAKITGTSIPSDSPVDTLAISQPNLFSLLQEEAGGLVREKILTTDALAHRAALLAEDLKTISIEGFELLPPRWLNPPGSDLLFRIVEYKFNNTARSMARVTDPFQVGKDVANMEGSRLDRCSLLYLSKVSEIGHRIIPHLWPGEETLRKNLELGTQHLNTLNEIWWLSKWHGIDPGSVEHERVVHKELTDSRKKQVPRADWSFTVLGGQVRINLEVKRRDGTLASTVHSKGVHLFGGNPEVPFSPSGTDEINVLAITSYHGGYITEREERRLVDEYLASLDEPVVDAVCVAVLGGNGSHENLYFPKGRDLEKKDLILRAILTLPDPEDHSSVGIVTHPRNLEDVIAESNRAKNE